MEERLLAHDIARQFFDAVVQRAREGGWLSSDHFSVDGTLIEAWASTKSFRPEGEKRIGGFRRSRYRGRQRTSAAALMAAASFNLVRLAKLQPGT